ncbi:putative RNA methyltransferase [Zancudomyces culisetae]|uniref:RNA methyltransferase n=1 Tax=Zancudomyces culisetae TaxID=1213189 RepID=A0A1R1PKY5_ZANCU|nr:putative RNA methyltransferase [Zancudomyces culisetae]|eukprot:OMH81624.1 putative RNA methyltransferase [Zancudomyces culisetae]
MPKNGHGSNRRDKQKKKGTQRAEEYRYGNYPNYYSKRKAAFKTLNPGKRGPSTGGIGENKTRDNQKQAQPSLQTRMDLDSDLDLNLDLNKELDQNILENCTTSSDLRIETLLNIRVTTTPQSSNTGCSNNKLFANKIAKVLDIGCNTAAVAIELAKRTNIQRIIGVDIDNSLIRTARQNLAVSKNEQENEQEQDREWERDEKRCYEDEHYPISMPILFGTIPHQHGQNSTNNSLADRVFLYAADWVNDDTTWLDNTNNQEADVSGNGGEGDEQVDSPEQSG